MNRKKLALIINIIIIIAELFAFGKSLLVDHTIALEYYTNDSNIIALISSLLFIFFYSKDKKIIKDIRFIATSCLTVTLLVVIFILCPMYNFNYKLLMFTDNFFILHTLVPVLSIISYTTLEDRSNKNYLCLLFTLIYGTILIILNILKVVDGPYPFLKVTSQSLFVSLLWGIIIIGGSYVIGLGLNYLNKKIKGAK